MMQLYILLRLRYWKFAAEPEVFVDVQEAKQAFEEYTRTSWEELEALSEGLGGDPDEILGGPFAGSRILTVEIPYPSCCEGSP